jgi:hypothetical protein
MIKTILNDNSTCCAICFEMLECGNTVYVDKDNDVICSDCKLTGEVNMITEQIITSQEYFNLSINELLEIRNEYDYTREECKLFDDGEGVIFFDDIEELKENLSQGERFGNGESLQHYINRKEYKIKAIVKTINERLAIILI